MKRPVGSRVKCGLASVLLLMMSWVFAHAAAGQKRATPKYHHAVHLSWKAPARSRDPVAGYNIYRSEGRSKHFRKLNTKPVTKPEYDDPAIHRGATYMYWVKSVDKRGKESDPSNRIHVHIP